MTSAFRLQGTAGNLEARDDFTQLIWHAAGAGERPSERPTDANDTLVDELAAFIDACETGTPFPVTPAEAIHNIAVMEAMMRSAANSGNLKTSPRDPEAKSSCQEFVPRVRAKRSCPLLTLD